MTPTAIKHATHNTTHCPLGENYLICHSKKLNMFSQDMCDYNMILVLLHIYNYSTDLAKWDKLFQWG